MRPLLFLQGRSASECAESSTDVQMDDDGEANASESKLAADSDDDASATDTAKQSHVKTSKKQKASAKGADKVQADDDSAQQQSEDVKPLSRQARMMAKVIIQPPLNTLAYDVLVLTEI